MLLPRRPSLSLQLTPREATSVSSQYLDAQVGPNQTSTPAQSSLPRTSLPKPATDPPPPPQRALFVPRDRDPVACPLRQSFTLSGPSRDGAGTPALGWTAEPCRPRGLRIARGPRPSSWPRRALRLRAARHRLWGSWAPRPVPPRAPREPRRRRRWQAAREAVAPAACVCAAPPAAAEGRREPPAPHPASSPAHRPPAPGLPAAVSAPPRPPRFPPRSGGGGGGGGASCVRLFIYFRAPERL